MKKDLRPPVPKKVLMPDEAGKMIAAGSEAEKKQVADFRKSIADEQFDMLNFTAEGQKWLADQEPKNQSSQMDMFNKMYQRRMMMMCVMPLTRGLNSDTIIQSVGMYVGMSLVNKEFREATQKTFHNALGNLYNVAANNIESEKWRKKLSPEKREAEVERLKAFRDKHLAAGNDGRVPYSPESAAMTDLKLSFEAYKQMCANRNDPDKIKEIQDNFASARETLHLMAKADGVSPEEISQNVRVMVGKMSDYHPEVNYLYSELTSGGVEKADFHDQKVARFDEKGNAAGVDTIKVWTGEYVDKNGDAFEAPFTPRVPMSDKDFLDATQDCLGSHWAIGSAKDLQDLSTAMNYVKANIGYSKEDMAEMPDEIKSNPNVAAFSKEMLKQANGYYFDCGGNTEQVEAGIKAVLSTNLEKIMRERPDIVRDWQAEYGSKKEAQKERRTPNTSDASYDPNSPDYSTGGRGKEAESKFSNQIENAIIPADGYGYGRG